MRIFVFFPVQVGAGFKLDGEGDTVSEAIDALLIQYRKPSAEEIREDAKGHYLHALERFEGGEPIQRAFLGHEMLALGDNPDVESMRRVVRRAQAFYRVDRQVREALDAEQKAMRQAAATKA